MLANQNTSLTKFTNKYSLQKTLRFELKPVSETAEHIEEFKSQTLKEIVRHDKKRAEDYKQMKKILDDYHRYFIEQVLSRRIFTDAQIDEAFAYYQSANKPNATKNDRDAYKKCQDKLRKIISDAFAKAKGEFYLSGKTFSKLINTSGSGKRKTQGKLWHWMKDRLDNNEISQEEFDRACKYIASFDKFTTYFTGFNQNRENLYVKDAKRSAIAYRIVHENMPRHFNNCRRFSEIQSKYSDLANQLTNYKEYFRPNAFTNYLNQSGIDTYNRIIGHSSDDINAKGVNQLINEYCQKNKIKPRDMPRMAILYKQLLSDRNNLSFNLDKFTDDKSMLDAIDQFYKQLQSDDLIGQLRECLREFLNDDNTDGIYLRNDTSLTDLSSKIWGHWSVVKDALAQYATDILKMPRKQKDSWLKSDAFSIKDVQQAVTYYLSNIENIEGVDDVESVRNNKITDYFTNFQRDGKDLWDIIEENYKNAKPVLELDQLNKNRQVLDETGKPSEGFLQIEKLKNLLDSIMDVVHFAKPLNMVKSGERLTLPASNDNFYDKFDEIYQNISSIIPLYNKVRNYVTQKPYKTDKFKINFENSTLLDGWDINKETDNLAILLRKDGKYYLGIMDKNSKDIFNYRIDPDDSEKKIKAKKLLAQKILANPSEPHYEKMIYKLLPDPAKMLPKVFFSARHISFYNPSDEIKEIREKGLFKKEANNPQALHKWIDFLKASITKHPEWNKYFHFEFAPTEEYTDINQFYSDVANQGYYISFDKIKVSYIDEKINTGQLFLFEIYNKDFSPHSKGRPNLHTSYWKMLFSPENLNDRVFQLNGQAEIFFRPASLNKNQVVIHRAQQPIQNKNPLNEKKQSVFDYDIIKDRRFTRDKFFFHCPITINFRQSNPGRFNDIVNDYLKENPNINIIGIDRGERHLLYYCAIDQNGNIIEQDSLNTITNSFVTEDKKITKSTDYHHLLNEKEKQRDAARKSWSTIENIKELKAGYLSHVIHKIATLMIKYNAIVVLEDLNFDFKRERFKVEKQVYQKFEKALIDKLNYLVFKDRQFGQPGHYLKGYQLTARFESFRKLGKQSGFLFYVTSDYTSKIDPVTGFANLLKTKYESVDKSRDFFGKFDSVRYNPEKQYFEFEFDYKKFNERTGKKSKWTVCTHNSERHYYDRHAKDYKCCDVTSSLKQLFDKYNIKYESGKNIINDIVNSQSADAAFYRELFFLLNLTLKLRYTYKDKTGEHDYILSPVADADGNFFDSRKYENISNPTLPANADANGAYNIARKGLLTLKQINETGRPSAIKNKDWFDFIQNI